MHNFSWFSRQAGLIVFCKSFPDSDHLIVCNYSIYWVFCVLSGSLFKNFFSDNKLQSYAELVSRYSFFIYTIFSPSTHISHPCFPGIQPALRISGSNVFFCCGWYFLSCLFLYVRKFVCKLLYLFICWWPQIELSEKFRFVQTNCLNKNSQTGHHWILKKRQKYWGAPSSSGAG